MNHNQIELGIQTKKRTISRKHTRKIIIGNIKLE